MGLKNWIEKILGKTQIPEQQKKTTPQNIGTNKININMEEKQVMNTRKNIMSSEKKIESIDMQKIRADYEKEKKIKEWPKIKEQIFQKYQISITDDAKKVAEELFGKSQDTVSIFFITDERAIKQRYMEGGDKAIEEYAQNLEQHAFAGGPITFTLLRRLNALKQAKIDGNVIDTEIDIDGFSPNGRIQYAINDIDLDGQKIPKRRKFSPRCEMTATITEGFHIGPFVAYDGLYFCTKEEMEQMMEKEKEKEWMNKGGMWSRGETETKSEMEDKNDGMGSTKEKVDVMKEVWETGVLCPHGSYEDLYCNQCDGDIIVSPSRKKVIGILLDVTGSMSGMKIERARIAVKKVLEKIPADSNINVVLTLFSTRFKDYYEDIIPYGIDFTQQIKEMVIDKLRRIEAEGDTPLYESINRFLDNTWNNGSLDKDKIFFPYTYLIIVSDGEDNHSELGNLIYRGKRDKDGFFAKLREYRDSGLITEIIPFAYGEGSIRDLRLVRELENMVKDGSGKMLVNETDPDRITESLTSTVDSILYGSDNLKMMGIPVSGLKKKIGSMESM